MLDPVAHRRDLYAPLELAELPVSERLEQFGLAIARRHHELHRLPRQGRQGHGLEAADVGELAVDLHPRSIAAAQSVAHAKEAPLTDRLVGLHTDEVLRIVDAELLAGDVLVGQLGRLDLQEYGAVLADRIVEVASNVDAHRSHLLLEVKRPGA